MLKYVPSSVLFAYNTLNKLAETKSVSDTHPNKMRTTSLTLDAAVDSFFFSGSRDCNSNLKRIFLTDSYFSFVPF